jgi:hypothetical protein
MIYHLDRQARHLADLCVEWQSKTRPIPCLWPMPESWGPSSVELQAAGHVRHHRQTEEQHDSDEEEEVDETDDTSSAEGGDDLLDAVEEFAVADQYRWEGQSREEMEIEDERTLELGHPSSPVRASPRKRVRILAD